MLIPVLTAGSNLRYYEAALTRPSGSDIRELHARRTQRLFVGRFGRVATRGATIVFIGLMREAGTPAVVWVSSINTSQGHATQLPPQPSRAGDSPRWQFGQRLEPAPNR